MIQAAMGWTDSHLHSFTIHGERYGMQLDDYPDCEIREREVTVIAAVGDEVRFSYEYDFGDGWDHEIVVEDRVRMPDGIKFAVCLDSERACPPEDCGGPGGYEHLLEVIADPEHDDFFELMGWLDGYFHPADFSLAAANAALQHLTTPGVFR